MNADRFPLSPILRVAARGVDPSLPPRLFAAAVNHRVGLDRWQRRRWEQIGLTVEKADELAVALRRHPSEIWDDWWERALTTESA